MSSSTCDRFNWMLFPLLAVVISSLAGIYDETKLLYGFAILSALGQTHYAVCVVSIFFISHKLPNH